MLKNLKNILFPPTVVYRSNKYQAGQVCKCGTFYPTEQIAVRRYFADRGLYICEQCGAKLNLASSGAAKAVKKRKGHRCWETGEFFDITAHDSRTKEKATSTITMYGLRISS
jgi:hypothetical protein